MKPPELVFHFLLLSSGTTYTAEVISGWRLSEECFDDPHSCDLIHYNFDDDHDVINILKLLDKVREGFFQAVLFLPPASTWSRARHFGPGGQPPVRSRAQPWGITDTTDNRHVQVVHDNRSVEISTWFTEQSLKCAASRTPLIFVFSEDFGGHAKSGPASLWSLQELRSLHGQDDASRGAGQTPKDRSVSSLIFQDCSNPYRLGGLHLQYTVLHYIILVRYRNPVAALLLILSALALPPTRTSILIWQILLESNFGNGAFLHFAARWSSTPLRMGTLRHHQCLNYSLFPRFLTLGRSSTNAGAYASSPGTFSGNSPTPSTLTSTSRDFLLSQLHYKVFHCPRLRQHLCILLFVPQVRLHTHLALRKRP